MSINKINTMKTRNELEKYRSEMNEAIDNRLKFITLCEEANKASEQSFGYIKEAFENISPELFKSKKGKSLIQKYTKTIKESKTLKVLHSIYESIRKTGPDTDLSFFVNKITNDKTSINSAILETERKELGKILAEGMLSIGNSSIDLMPNVNIAFDSAIEFIAENKSTLKNVAEFSDAVKIIKENISKHTNKSNTFENVNIEKYSSALVEEFNRKYDTLLSEEEKLVIRTINSNPNKEDLFNDYKSTCLNKLSEAKDNFSANGDSEAVKRINSVIEKVENKVFIAENIIADICGFVDLVKLFD